MSVKCVRKYEAEDGSLHDSSRDAFAHNAQFKVLKNVKKLLEMAAGGSPGTSHLSFVNTPALATAMRDEMNKILAYHREYTGKIKVKKKLTTP